MCFLIHNDHQVSQIATEDIVCFKRMIPFNHNILITPYRDFEYKIGKTYSAEFSDKLGIGIIEEGLHSYTNKERAKLWKTSDEIVVKCIIPKGSIYYFNPNDEEYVSNKLYVKKTLMLYIKNLLLTT